MRCTLSKRLYCWTSVAPHIWCIVSQIQWCLESLWHAGMCVSLWLCCPQQCNLLDALDCSRLQLWVTKSCLWACSQWLHPIRFLNNRDQPIFFEGKPIVLCNIVWMQQLLKLVALFNFEHLNPSRVPLHALADGRDKCDGDSHDLTARECESYWSILPPHCLQAAQMFACLGPPHHTWNLPAVWEWQQVKLGLGLWSLAIQRSETPWVHSSHHSQLSANKSTQLRPMQPCCHWQHVTDRAV